MGGWGCPHEFHGQCQRVENRDCEPGMKGCILAGRFVFSDPAKNTARALRDKGGKVPAGRGAIPHDLARPGCRQPPRKDR